MTETNYITAEDDVFSVNQSQDPHQMQPICEDSMEPTGSRLQIPVSRSIMSSEEMFPATPYAKVNPSRGKKNMGGPALSLMRNLGSKLSLRDAALPQHLRREKENNSSNQSGQ